MRYLLWILVVGLILGLLNSEPAVFAKESKTTIRVGHFPNVTHAQGVIGQANGWFEKALGKNVEVDWKIFNAGPSAIEALFAGQIDLTYIGPNPAINGYVKSRGEALRIIAGAASGGAALVVRAGSGIKGVKDFDGKKIASPQLGNTQDVALRSWLNENGFKLREKGGTVQVVPLANPDQLTLFLRKEIDGAWTVEPWVSRLIFDGGGKLFLNESDLWTDGKYVTTHLVVSTKFFKEHPDLVKKWVAAHVELTNWINKNPEEAKIVLNEELKRETGKALPQEILNESMKRIDFTYDPIANSLFKSANSAFELGFLGGVQPDLSNIYDLTILNRVLKQKGLEPVKIGIKKQQAKNK
ncbi:MAG TPA: ABC transporter substrate-binding protein [Thermodesulfobacteriota bacterium]|nr:ABC transporter substrate-binding protein [Thermodesulfobacteriota bacterium]